jgi:putative glutamine amidotransferase
VPILGICRGMQEMNVAFGGDLFDELHAVQGHRDHRSDKSLPYDQRYMPRHPVHVIDGTSLKDILCSVGVRETSFAVNSLHGQGISRLGDRIVVQATADDGVIEAVAVESARAFAFGVQWHIEWSSDAQVLDACVTRAFKAACEARLHGLERARGALE